MVNNNYFYTLKFNFSVSYLQKEQKLCTTGTKNAKATLINMVGSKVWSGSFGYSLLIFTIFGCIIEPVSGFWLFLPQALIIIFARKKR